MDKSLKKLSRLELLELMMKLSEDNEVLMAENAHLKQLVDQRPRLPRSAKVGSLAEAALQSNGFFEAAQRSADDYLREIKRMRDQLAARTAGMQEQAPSAPNVPSVPNVPSAQPAPDEIDREARIRAQAIIKHANSQAESILADARAKAEALVVEANRQSRDVMSRANRQAEAILSAARNSAGSRSSHATPTSATGRIMRARHVRAPEESA